MDNGILKARAKALLCRCGEDVVVVEGSVTRSIKAIVTRLPPSFGNDGKKLEARVVLDVVNDATLGIDASAVDLGKTKVRLAVRPGAEVRDWSIGMGNDADGWTDPGMITLALR